MAPLRAATLHRLGGANERWAIAAEAYRSDASANTTQPVAVEPRVRYERTVFCSNLRIELPDVLQGIRQDPAPSSIVLIDDCSEQIDLDLDLGSERISANTKARTRATIPARGAQMT